MRARYSEYRDSGIEWLGDIPAHWHVQRLKRVASINDETLSEKEDPLRPVAYVDISSVNSTAGITETEEMVFEDAPSRARRLVNDGDTIVSTVRTYLRAIAPIQNPPSEMVVSTGFAVVRPRDLDSGFGSWVLREQGLVSEIVARSTGVSYPAINPSQIANLAVLVPPVGEQQAIAAFLDRETGKIDELVEKKRLLLERLAEYRTALITRTVTKGLPASAAEAAGLDPSPRLKPSSVEWLGDIPAHWHVQRLGRLLARPLKYGANAAAELDDPNFPRFIRITDIDDSGRLREETFRSIPFDIAELYLLESGDLLFARSGSVGRTFLYEESWGCCAYAGYLIRARFNRRVALPKFVSYWSASKVYAGWVRASAIQATIENVNAERYSRMSVLVPPVGEQQAIAAFLDERTRSIDLLCERVETAIERLEEYRTALVTAAVTGKINVLD